MGNKQPSGHHQRPNRTDPTMKIVNWSKAPHDILEEISNHIDSIKDYVSFRQVCSSWRSAAPKEKYNQSPPIKLPWLMLETNNNSIRKFFSLANGKLVHQTILPTRPAYLTLFQSRGWLFNSGTDLYGCIYLSHSIFNVSVDLPNLIDNIDGSRIQILLAGITKGVLTTHKIMSSDFFIFIIYGGKLWGWRPGAVAWTYYELPLKYCKDVAYNKKRLYVIDGCTVARCKIEGLRLVVCEQVTLEEPCECGNLYLVEPLNTDLDSLFVVFHSIPFNSRTRFYVFEVDLTKGTFKEVNNLGDGAIFFGGHELTKYHIKNASMLAKVLGVRRTRPANCIYMMIRNSPLESINGKLGGVDLYYYNLEDKSFNLCIGGLLSDWVSDLLMFVTPMFI